METIVVGYDGSPECEPAVTWAVREAIFRHGRVHIVHAYPVAAAEYDYVPADEFKAIADRVAGEALAVARDALPPREDIEISVETVNALPAVALLDVARHGSASLLVVGSRGHGSVAGALLGSVSQRCASKAPCPVVIVHPTEDAMPIG